MDKEMEVYQESVNRMEDEMANKFTKTDDLMADHEHEKYRLQTIKALV